MDIMILLFWVVSIILFIYSLTRDHCKTFETMKKTRRMMGNMMLEIIAIIFLIGLVLTFLPPESVEKVLGSSHELLATLSSAIIGSITLIPGFVAFPLIGSLIDMGANLVPTMAFLTTLTMVGVLTFPLEKDEFGFKFAFSRNVLSFIFAILIALGMGVIL